MHLNIVNNKYMNFINHEIVCWQCCWRVEKYLANRRLAVIRGNGNLVTTSGANALWTALTGGPITPFSHTHAHIGVGDATTAEDPSQTDLQAASNKFRKAMDAGYPHGSGNQVTFRTTFAGGEANFAWNEFGVFNAFSGGVMLNRKVAALGTKASGAVWVFTVTLTLS